MPKELLSTYKIVMDKALNLDINESWIEWALEMMEAGFESDNLYMLAGISKPYNQFELQELTNKVLADLNLDFSDKKKVVRNYVYHLLLKRIGEQASYFKTLSGLKDICIELDMDNAYMDFYLLYFAKDDLMQSDIQWHWNGANKANIDTIIKERFQIFINDIEMSEVDK